MRYSRNLIKKLNEGKARLVDHREFDDGMLYQFRLIKHVSIRVEENTIVTISVYDSNHYSENSFEKDFFDIDDANKFAEEMVKFVRNEDPDITELFLKCLKNGFKQTVGRHDYQYLDR